MPINKIPDEYLIIYLSTMQPQNMMRKISVNQRLPDVSFNEKIEGKILYATFRIRRWRGDKTAYFSIYFSRNTGRIN